MLEGAGLSARLPPLETLKPIIAPKMEEVEDEELEQGEKGVLRQVYKLTTIENVLHQWAHRDR